MEENRLIRVLKSLNRKELKKFSQFLNSPYHNQREDVIILYDQIRPHIEAENPLPEKVSLFNHLFPNQAFSATQFDLLMSYLYKLLKSFIIFEETLSNPAQNEYQLAVAYRRRGLEKDFTILTKALKKNLSNSNLRNAAYYNLYYQLQWEEHQMLSAQRPTEEVKLKEMAQTIDINYLALKLKHLCLISTHQSVYQSDFEVGFFKQILPFIEHSNFLQIPAIAIYYHYYCILQNIEAEESFQHFKRHLFEYAHQFSSTEIRDLYLLAINYCVRCANEGKEGYLEELFELYKEGLKSESLLQNGMLSRFTFHNITGAGLRNGQFEWTEQFIHSYKSSLEKRYRESAYSFSLARLAYSQKHYNEALALLQKSNYRDLLLNLAAKTLQLKIYYELAEYDLLSSHLDAMDKFILRKHLIGYHKENYRNIVNYTRRMVNLNFYDKKAVEALFTKIKTAEVLTEKEWFLKQLDL